MAAQDTPNTSAVVYDKDAYLAYVMTTDEESLGADAAHSSANPALPPADTEIAASTIMTPHSGDEIETALDFGFGEIVTQTHCNTTPTLPPTPATDVTEISSQAPRHCLGTKENRPSILGEVDVQALFSASDASPCVTKATTSNITTPSGEEIETKLNTEFGRVGEVDVQTHDSTKLAVSPADTETTTSTKRMPPGDEMETTRTLGVTFGAKVDMQTHSNTTSTPPPAASVAEVTTSTTLPKDEGGPSLDVIGSGQTGEVDVRAPDSETKTLEHTKGTHHPN